MEENEEKSAASVYFAELKHGMSMEVAKEEMVGKLTLAELIINEIQKPIANDKNKYKKFLARFSQTKTKNVEVNISFYILFIVRNYVII